MNWNIFLIIVAVVVFSIGFVFITGKAYRALLRMFRS